MPVPPRDEIGARLRQAAAEVFAEKGYDGAGVAEIARRAGVTTGAIYSRYSGKAELMQVALDDLAEDELDALFADHRFDGRMEDIIRIAGSHLVSETDDTGVLLEAMVSARRHPEVRAMLREDLSDRRQKLIEIIEQAKAGGGIDPGLDTDALVAFCHAVGFGFLLFGAIDYPMPDADRWAELITYLVTAIGPGHQPIEHGSGPALATQGGSSSGQ